MNDTDLRILEMYYKDGMKEKEIADSLKLSLFIVYDVLTAFDWTEDEVEKLRKENERLRDGLLHAVELIEDIGLDASIERAALRQEV